MTLYEYEFDSELATKPLRCVLMPGDDGDYLILTEVWAGDNNVYGIFECNADLHGRVERLAFDHFERQARELRAERLYESRMERIAA
jgi:hypothetical protein